MTSTEKSGLERIIESGAQAEESALEAVRRFVETVNGIFPDAGEDGARRKVIDSAFKMTEQLVGTWTQAAEKIAKAAGDALASSRGAAGSSRGTAGSSRGAASSSRGPAGSSRPAAARSSKGATSSSRARARAK